MNFNQASILNAQNVTLTPTLGDDNASVVITATQTISQATLTMQLAQAQNQLAQLTAQVAQVNTMIASLQGYLSLIPQVATQAKPTGA